jgi:hypothetical protein
MEDAIERAKNKVIKAYDMPGSYVERAWIAANADSYREVRQRVAIFVREGSPPKGYVIANYGHCTVMAFSVYDELLFKWTGLSHF